MLGSPLRCCGHMKHMKEGVLAISNSNIGNVVNGLGRQAYSKDKGKDCCKDVSQTEGKRIEVWPKPDPPPPAWRCECPKEPQPTNYDPYRIKVPDIVVPPLPPSNAKALPNEDARELFKNAEINFSPPPSGMVQDLFHNSPIVHPDYWKDRPEKKLTDVIRDVLPKLGYHGKIKYKYAFHEPWKPIDRMGLLEQAEKEEAQKSNENYAQATEKQMT